MEPSVGRIPRLYAAASLKLLAGHEGRGEAQERYSAALCRGLIEATRRRHGGPSVEPVFRGFMPRPH